MKQDKDFDELIARASASTHRFWTDAATFAVLLRGMERQHVPVVCTYDEVDVAGGQCALLLHGDRVWAALSGEAAAQLRLAPGTQVVLTVAGAEPGNVAASAAGTDTKKEEK